MTAKDDGSLDNENRKIAYKTLINNFQKMHKEMRKK